MARPMLALAAVAGCGRVAFDPLALEPDAPPGPYVVCPAFEPAHVSLPSLSHHEPGLHPDGLRLIASNSSVEHEASRTLATGKFGDFGAVTAFRSNLGDPAFGIIEGELVGFGAAGPMPRHIEICRAPASTNTCTPIQIVDEATGQVIVDDHDGPAPAVLDGEPVLAFSRGDEIYLGRATATDLTAWIATRIEVPATAMVFDDPTLTPDGEILLVQEASLGIYAMRWNRGLARYDELQPLYAGTAGTPTVRDTGSGTLEILFTRNTRGVVEAHHAFCERTR